MTFSRLLRLPAGTRRNCARPSDLQRRTYRAQRQLRFGYPMQSIEGHNQIEFFMKRQPASVGHFEPKIGPDRGTEVAGCKSDHIGRRIHAYDGSLRIRESAISAVTFPLPHPTSRTCSIPVRSRRESTSSAIACCSPDSLSYSGAFHSVILFTRRDRVRPRTA